MRRRRRHAPPAVNRSGRSGLRSLVDVLALPRRSPLYPELARALGAADALHVLRTDLAPVPVRPTATTSQAGAYRSRGPDPIDLRVSRAHGRVTLSFLHELGHFLDHEHDWALGPALRRGAGIPSRAPTGASSYRRRYFDSRKEVWARAYAQTVLTRSNDPWLRGHLDDLLAADDAFVWPEAVFEPVAAAVERVLTELGLLRPAAALAAA